MNSIDYDATREIIKNEKKVSEIIARITAENVLISTAEEEPHDKKKPDNKGRPQTAN